MLLSAFVSSYLMFVCVFARDTVKELPRPAFQPTQLVAVYRYTPKSNKCRIINHLCVRPRVKSLTTARDWNYFFPATTFPVTDNIYLIMYICMLFNSNVFSYGKWMRYWILSNYSTENPKIRGNWGHASICNGDEWNRASPEASGWYMPFDMIYNDTTSNIKQQKHHLKHTLQWNTSLRCDAMLTAECSCSWTTRSIPIVPYIAYTMCAKVRPNNIQRMGWDGAMGEYASLNILTKQNSEFNASPPPPHHHHHHHQHQQIYFFISIKIMKWIKEREAVLSCINLHGMVLYAVWMNTWKFIRPEK